MKIYLAAPLFSMAERQFNISIKNALINKGYNEIWLPQEKEPRERSGIAIFEKDKEGLDWCDIVLANMDNSDPDSGTSWECGYAYANNKPIINYRTDLRETVDLDSHYNIMLSQSSNSNIYLSSLKYTFEDLINEIIINLNKIKS